MRRFILFSIMLVGFSAAAPAFGDTVYQTPRDFVFSAFEGPPPKPEAVAITQELKPFVDKILQHERFSQVRVRYWREEERTVWLFNEIGRAKPITLGLVINNGIVESIKVLIYRETHGGEVRRPFFVTQFVGAKLESNLDLDSPIENMSGATLSVNALRNTARLGLFLDGLAARERGRIVDYDNLPD